jgi:hypothetical protein
MLPYVIIHNAVSVDGPRSLYRASDLIAASGVLNLKLIGVDQLTVDLVRLRYGIVK